MYVFACIFYTINAWKNLGVTEVCIGNGIIRKVISYFMDCFYVLYLFYLNKILMDG